MKGYCCEVLDLAVDEAILVGGALVGREGVGDLYNHSLQSREPFSTYSVFSLPASFLSQTPLVTQRHHCLKRFDGADVLWFDDISTLVILCRLPEKGRKEIEEIVEEMIKRGREERGTGMKVKKQKK